VSVHFVVVGVCVISASLFFFCSCVPLGLLLLCSFKNTSCCLSCLLLKSEI
jgi:hypothetical protein